MYIARLKEQEGGVVKKDEDTRGCRNKERGIDATNGGCNSVWKFREYITRG